MGLPAGQLGDDLENAPPVHQTHQIIPRTRLQPGNTRPIAIDPLEDPLDDALDDVLDDPIEEPVDRH